VLDSPVALSEFQERVNRRWSYLLRLEEITNIN